MDFARTLFVPSSLEFLSEGERERERGMFGKICLEIRCLYGARYRSIKRRIYGGSLVKGGGLESMGLIAIVGWRVHSDSSRAQPFYIPRANSCAMERLVERHCFLLSRVGIVVESGVRKG